MRPAWNHLVALDFERLRSENLFRQRRVVRPVDATHIEYDGRLLVNFSSNNYLGLTQHPRICKAVKDAVIDNGFGSGAAPLISGFSPAHASAERAIADWKGTQSAIIFPSGYQANLAAIQTAAAIGRLTGGARFLVDKLAHASLIDAVRGSGEPFRIFPHQGLAKLDRLLAKSNPNQLQIVVTESIFSMDGDAADLCGLMKLKEKHGFLLILDEAHATGVYGPNGSGLAAELDLRKMVDVSVFTLSKALGGIGGVVCGSALFGEALVNYGRSYLFSTGVPTAVAAAGEAAIGVLCDEPQRQERVRMLARHVRNELKNLPAEVSEGNSPIIPLILGSEELALRAADKLLGEGIFTVAVRPPTVPRGSSRLRITLSCEHTDDEITRLLEGIRGLNGLSP